MTGRTGSIVRSDCQWSGPCFFFGQCDRICSRGFAAPKSLGVCLTMSLMYPALMLINGIFFHILPTLGQRRFSPGTITAVALFLPVALWTFYGAYKDGVLSGTTLAISLIGGGLLMASPILLLRTRGGIGQTIEYAAIGRLLPVCSPAKWTRNVWDREKKFPYIGEQCAVNFWSSACYRRTFFRPAAFGARSLVRFYVAQVQPKRVFALAVATGRVSKIRWLQRKVTSLASEEAGFILLSSVEARSAGYSGEVSKQISCRQIHVVDRWTPHTLLSELTSLNRFFHQFPNP